MDASLKRFNTPKRENINILSNEALGLEKVTRDWNDEDAMTLTGLLDSRHSIAHTGSSKAHLSYQSNFQRMKTVFHLAEQTERRLISLLQDVHGASPSTTSAELNFRFNKTLAVRALYLCCR